jgi:hypothetical protein
MIAMIAESERIPERRRDLALWAGILLAPFAWATQLLVNYSITPSICVNEQKWLLHLVSLIAALIALGGAFIARRAWTRLTSGSTLEGEARESGRRFMALGGIVLSLFFVLVIFALDLPNWWLDPCQR